MMKEKILLLSLFAVAAFAPAWAASDEETDSKEKSKIEKVMSRLTIGGYGEAVYSYNMFSDNYLRYR